MSDNTFDVAMWSRLDIDGVMDNINIKCSEDKKMSLLTMLSLFLVAILMPISVLIGMSLKMRSMQLQKRENVYKKYIDKI